MGTTIEIDGDVLEAARAAARQRGQSVDAFVSNVLREQLLARPAAADVRDGIRLLPAAPGTPPVTHELIRRLMDETE